VLYTVYSEFSDVRSIMIARTDKVMYTSIIRRTQMKGAISYVALALVTIIQNNINHNIRQK